jgi:tripartite-type tricarboxylate transporter receptor subunit TctC
LLLCALPHATNPSLYPKLPYDTKKDFAPITLAARVPSVMLVTATSPAKSVAELIALSKTGRGVNYSSPGNGTAAHLGMELFKLTSGLNAQQISYKGAGPQVTALIAGEVDVAFATISTSKPHVMSGRLRALAVASGKRAVQLPNVPALAEVGYPGLDIYAVWAAGARRYAAPRRAAPESGVQRCAESPGCPRGLRSGWCRGNAGNHRAVREIPR